MSKMDKITTPAIQRLASTAGVKRVSGTVYYEIRSIIDQELGTVLRNAYVFMHSEKRKTLALKDVLDSISEQGVSFAYSPALKKTVKASKGSRSKKDSSPDGRPHRFKSGTVSLRQIKKHQKESEKLYIAKARFLRRVRSLAQEHVEDVRVSSDAALALQLYIEKYVINILIDANLQAIHAGRLTIMDSDLYIVLRLKKPQC